MDDREQYIGECADYLQTLVAQHEELYSDTETERAIDRLEATRRALGAALSAARQLVDETAGKRRNRTGMAPALPSILHTQLVRSLTITTQGIEDLKAYRDGAKPDRYRLARSAVNLAAGFELNASAARVGDLASEIMDSAQLDDAPWPKSKSTIENWVAAFRDPK